MDSASATHTRTRLNSHVRHSPDRLDRLDGFTHYTTRMLRNSATPGSLRHTRTQRYGISIYLSVSIYLSLSIYLSIGGAIASSVP